MVNQIVVVENEQEEVQHNHARATPAVSPSPVVEDDDASEDAHKEGEEEEERQQQPPSPPPMHPMAQSQHHLPPPSHHVAHQHHRARPPMRMHIGRDQETSPHSGHHQHGRLSAQ